MPHTQVSPIIRPVYVLYREVPRPHLSPAALIRHPEHTIVHIHPGADIIPVGLELNRILDDSEYSSWAPNYIPEGNLADFRKDPLAHIPPNTLKIPMLASYIPPPLRAPWASYA